MSNAEAALAACQADFEAVEWSTVDFAQRHDLASLVTETRNFFAGPLAEEAFSVGWTPLELFSASDGERMGLVPMLARKVGLHALDTIEADSAVGSVLGDEERHQDHHLPRLAFGGKVVWWHDPLYAPGR